VFQRHVGVRRDHPAAHELGRAVRRFAPEHRPATDRILAPRTPRARERGSDRPEAPSTDRVASPTLMQAIPPSTSTRSEFVPDGPELVVHPVEGGPAVAVVQRVADRGIEPGKEVVPHLDHRIRRRRDDEFDRLVGHVRRSRESPAKTRWVVSIDRILSASVP